MFVLVLLWVDLVKKVVVVGTVAGNSGFYKKGTPMTNQMTTTLTRL